MEHSVRKAYIILAHQNETQLLRLIKRLDDGSAHFYLHIDLNSALKKKDIMFRENKNIQVLPGIRTEWGSFNLVRATLNAMQAIKKSAWNFDRIILLSGQDYPIKSNAAINDFFAMAKYRIFMSHAAFPDYRKWPSNGGAFRLNKYFWGFSWFFKYAARLINFLSSFLTIFKRKLHHRIKHYHGSQWWTIDSYALDYILDFLKRNPGYVAFHRHTFAPDELFFQTILLNASDSRITGSILNDNKVFMKWAGSSAAHPETLDSEDFEAIQNSPALFARKFDPDTDPAILDRIDRELLFIHQPQNTQQDG